MQNNSISIVIATKDRPDELRNVLRSLSRQTSIPGQIIIVDASEKKDKIAATDFKGFNLEYIYHRPPSASAQRNRGIQAVDDRMEFVGFLDDDITLETDAFEKMVRFWRKAPLQTGGCSFNCVNIPMVGSNRLKRLPIVQRLGLYGKRKGRVMPSGWQTLIGKVDETTFVDWLPSTASVWRRKIFDTFQFDEYFDRYSYLEDLDFSYSVRKYYQLVVAHDARF